MTLQFNYVKATIETQKYINLVSSNKQWLHFFTLQIYF